MPCCGLIHLRLPQVTQMTACGPGGLMRRPICFKISLLTAAVLAVGLTSAQGANTAGTLDKTFGNGGTVAATLVPVANDSSDAVPEAIRFQSNGDILVLVDVTITGANASATTQ